MIRRIALLAAASLAFAALAQSASAAPDRVALVIGNGAYVNASRLPNPPNDAADVAATLRKLGFDVVEGRDLDKRAMEAKILEFGGKLDRAGVALFFYAGHGLQVGGKNYLAPVDAKLERAGNLNFEAIDVGLVLAQMETEKRVNLVFLDACRDNPLARTLARSLGASRSAAVGQGLASIQSAVGTMIAYATQPDNVALDGDGTRNSPFTTALLKHVVTPGLEIRSMMTRVRADVLAATREKQVPWDHSSLIGEVVLVPGNAPQAATPPTSPGGDEFAWSILKDSKDADQLRRFVEQYPSSTRRNEAAALLLKLEQTRIAALTPAVPAPVAVAPPLPQAPTPGALADNRNSIETVAFSPDGGRVAAGTTAYPKYIVKIWDVQSGQPVQTLTGHSDVVDGVAWSANGRLIASYSRDKSIRLWDATTGQHIRTLDQTAGLGTQVSFASDSRKLATLGGAFVKIWDVSNGTLLHKLEGHFSTVLGIGYNIISTAISQDGRRAISGAADQKVWLWDLDRGKLIRTLDGHGNVVSSVAFLAGDRVAGTGTSSKSTTIWNAGTGKIVRTLLGHENQGTMVAASANGRVLASANKHDKAAIVWDIETGQIAKKFSDFPGTYINALAVSPDGRRLAVGTDGGLTVLLIDPAAAPAAQSSVATPPEGVRTSVITRGIALGTGLAMSTSVTASVGECRDACVKDKKCNAWSYFSPSYIAVVGGGSTNDELRRKCVFYEKGALGRGEVSRELFNGVVKSATSAAASKK